MTTENIEKPAWLKNFVPAPPNRWQPGRSGNPLGKKKGTLNKRTLAAQAIVDEAGAILDVVVAKAKAGDMTAAALIINRLIPTLRPRAERVQFEFDAKGSLAEQGEQVLQAMADGDLDPDTSKAVLESITAMAGLRQLDELLRRIEAIELRRDELPDGSRGGVLCV